MGKLERWSRVLWRGTMQSLFWCTLLATIIFNSVFSTIPHIFANVPEAGGNATVVNPVGEGVVSINEDAPTPEVANIRLIVPNLVDSGGGTPTSIRIISVTGGSLSQSGGTAITLGASGTVLSLSTSRLDLRFAPTANRDTAASFQYVVVDPHNSAVNSAESTATINITSVDDPPILATSSGDIGDGLYGTYYLGDWQLSGTSSSRIDATINFLSNVSSPNPTTVWGMAGINPEQYSIRWTGKVKAPVDGTYYFRTYTDDGARLYVNGNLVIDEWIPQGSTYWTSPGINLTANNKYDIKFEYYERGGGETAGLLWSYPGQDYQTIPQAYLFPGTSRSTLSYVKSSGAVVVDDGVVIADIDSTTIANATVAISSNYLSSEDLLGFTNQNGISGSFNSTTGTLTLSGLSSVANYQTALQSVTYTNNNTNPNTATRTVTFTVNDGTTASNATTRDIAIDATNDPPVITQGASASVTMDEDATPTAFNLSLGAADPENGTMTWSISSAASHGTASVSGTGNSKAIIYDPTVNYNGSDSFVVRVEDNLGATDAITINVTINPRNDAPVNTVAPSVTGTFHPGATLTAHSGTWNDNTDQTPGTIAYTYQWRRFNDQLGNGLSVVGTGSTYTIQNGDLNKYLVLRVTATDNGEGLPASQAVSADTGYTVVGNVAPVIMEGQIVTATIDEDSTPTAFTQTLSASDEDGDTLTWSILTPAEHGATAVSGSGNTRTINYEPTENYHGADSFVVVVTDPYGESDVTTVEVYINPRNDDPHVMVMPSINQPLGVTRVDHVLTVSNGTWNDDDDLTPGTISFTYQWQRCTTIACADAANIASATASSYTLKNADYGKYIRVKVTATDNGEGLPTTQGVTVYTTPIGQILAADSTISINTNQQYTNSGTVTLGVLVNNILNGATEMSFSEDPLFASATWVPFNVNAHYQLSSGDGQKTLYVRFRDADGNVSESHSNTILLDTIAELAVAQVDQTTLSTTLSAVTTNSTKPAFAGIAEPGATVTITIHSDPITGTTTADLSGNWSWMPSQELPYGTHQAQVTTQDMAGNTKEVIFSLVVAAPVTATPASSSSSASNNTGLRVTRTATSAPQPSSEINSLSSPASDTAAATPSSSSTISSNSSAQAGDAVAPQQSPVVLADRFNRFIWWFLLVMIIVFACGVYWHKHRSKNDAAMVPPSVY